MTAKSKKDKLQKHGESGLSKPDHYVETSNSYTPLTTLIDMGDTIPVTVNSVHLSKMNIKPQQYTNGTTHSKKVRNSAPSKCSKRQKKILSLGDSHTRGLAEEVQLHLGKDFVVQATVKPAASI